MFPHSIHFIKKCYKFCTFDAIICKDIAAINCITIQHKKKFIPVNFDGSFYASILNESDKASITSAKPENEHKKHFRVIQTKFSLY
jgi:hypothetical protein